MTYEETYQSLARQVERDLSIAVVTEEIDDDYLGYFNGSVIAVNNACSPEIKLYVLIHLIGHTIQHLVEESLISEEDYSPAQTDVFEYELESAQYSLSYLHNIGIHELDSWLSLMFHVDSVFFERLLNEQMKGEYSLPQGPVELIVPKEYGQVTNREWKNKHAFAPANYREWGSNDH